MNCEWAKLEIVFGDDCYVEKLANLECIGGDKVKEEWLENPYVRVTCVLFERAAYTCVLD